MLQVLVTNAVIMSNTTLSQLQEEQRIRGMQPRPATWPDQPQTSSTPRLVAPQGAPGPVSAVASQDVPTPNLPPPGPTPEEIAAEQKQSAAVKAQQQAQALAAAQKQAQARAAAKKQAEARAASKKQAEAKAAAKKRAEAKAAAKKRAQILAAQQKEEENTQGKDNDDEDDENQDAEDGEDDEETKEDKKEDVEKDNDEGKESEDDEEEAFLDARGLIRAAGMCLIGLSTPSIHAFHGGHTCQP